MSNHHETIRDFYAAFTNHDAEAMARCYHSDIEFSDPVFGKLKGKTASDMWKMLIEKSKGSLKIEFSNINADGDSGSAKWIAYYRFSKTNRDVANHIKAEFKFKDGLIIKHDDHFDLWKWSRQAFGFKGLLLGWSGFMQNKIKEQALLSLKNYQLKSKILL
ncbi:MAG TPA: nuclear transport factor 2 family protein [Flavobacterium sp.]|nr:nuclear transport factor 2 family protein [Flavobacterium sp.]